MSPNYGVGTVGSLGTAAAYSFAAEVLNPNQLQNFNRYLKKLPNADEELSDGSVEFSSVVSGNVPGPMPSTQRR